MSHKKVDLVFTPESYKDLESLSSNLNISPERVIGQAIALLKMVQGRKVVLKTDKGNVEINNYSSQPSQVEIKK